MEPQKNVQKQQTNTEREERDEHGENGEEILGERREIMGKSQSRSELLSSNRSIELPFEKKNDSRIEQKSNE